MDNGILGLPVHDSVIVQEQHEEFTREVMTQEYKKELNFEPSFDDAHVIVSPRRDRHLCHHLSGIS
jgi:hypothetical protein